MDGPEDRDEDATEGVVIPDDRGRPVFVDLTPGHALTEDEAEALRRVFREMDATLAAYAAAHPRPAEPDR